MNHEATAAMGAATLPGRFPVHYLHCANPVSGMTAQRSATVLQLDEEGEYYVPNLLADDSFEFDTAMFDAAEEHASSLREAEGCIDAALNLADVLRAAMGDTGDSRAMQVDTVLTIIREKLTKAHARLDDYDTNHLNLFIAYTQLKNKKEVEPI